MWSVTSAKGGHGVESLRDDGTETYWQCAPLAQTPQRSPEPLATARPTTACTYCSRALPDRSDGAQPHIVSIAFQRKVELLVRRHRSARPAHVLTWHAQELALYVDFKHDESYTPRAVAVKVGNSIQDMKARFGLDVRIGAQCSR